MGEDGEAPEAREQRPGRVRDSAEEKAVDLAHQAELDEVWARRRAKETEALTKQEARNYEETHATDEQAGISPTIVEE